MTSLQDSLRDGPRDECGVFGVYAPDHEVARLSYFALYALQHRGQESAGIASAEGGHIMTVRDLGLVSQVFDEAKLKALAGDMAVGHVRYSTTGSSAWENAQPIYRSDVRDVALAHNGNLINAVELHAEMREQGVEFRSPAGLRPLALGRIGDRYCVASESCAFDIIGAEFMREVLPGELIGLGPNGVTTEIVAESDR